MLVTLLSGSVTSAAIFLLECRLNVPVRRLCWLQVLMCLSVQIRVQLRDVGHVLVFPRERSMTENRCIQGVPGGMCNTSGECSLC